MATIYYAIEPMWTRDNFRATLTINDADLEGLSPGERENVITEIVGDAVAEQMQWGWTEVGP